MATVSEWATNLLAFPPETEVVFTGLYPYTGPSNVVGGIRIITNKDSIIEHRVRDDELDKTIAKLKDCGFPIVSMDKIVMIV